MITFGRLFAGEEGYFAAIHTGPDVLGFGHEKTVAFYHAGELFLANAFLAAENALSVFLTLTSPVREYRGEIELPPFGTWKAVQKGFKHGGRAVPRATGLLRLVCGYGGSRVVFVRLNSLQLAVQNLPVPSGQEEALAWEIAMLRGVVEGQLPLELEESTLEVVTPEQWPEIVQLNRPGFVLQHRLREISLETPRRAPAPGEYYTSPSLLALAWLEVHKAIADGKRFAFCGYCGKVFAYAGHKKEYCSGQCRKRYWEEKQKHRDYDKATHQYLSRFAEKVVQGKESMEEYLAAWEKEVKGYERRHRKAPSWVKLHPAVIALRKMKDVEKWWDYLCEKGIPLPPKEILERIEKTVGGKAAAFLKEGK